MILQSLVDYYEKLAGKGLLERPGWSKVKISWALDIDREGKLIAIYPLKTQSSDGKRLIPRELVMPAPVKRSSGISPNFLCDHSSYLLGEDTKGKPERTKDCYMSSKELHNRLLGGLGTPEALAVVRFFENWDETSRNSHSEYQKQKEALITGENITFMFEGKYLSEYPEVQKAWQDAYDDEDGDQQICMITGRPAVPQKIHPSIKNVRGAQSSGAALVSFNAQAFCSYGKEQNENAPTGKYAAFAYTTALNYLLSDRDHVKYIGNSAVVYWAKDAETGYQDIFSSLLDGPNNTITEEDLNGIMKALAAGKDCDYSGIPIHPDNEFFILGISPNAARLSIRFFYHNGFGNIVSNIKKHYEDIHIVTDNRGKFDTFPLWALLRETINAKSSDKMPLPQMSGDLMKSMITGSRYPETLMNQTMLRIRAEHSVTRGRAGIIKAYLIRNTSNMADGFKEVSTVSLNQESNYTPYVLGRLFAVLEGLQQSANPGINATIKDRYFNSACATPAAVFPILLKLSNSHLKKLEKGASVYWSKQIGNLTDRLGLSFPAHCTLQEQGAFILGYYHQTQKRFEKKSVNNKEEQ